MNINPETLTVKDKYKLLTGIIAPRPIAFVSTKSFDGINNVAPFSFFSPVTSDPPTIMFSINSPNGRTKDTLRNIELHPQFVVNLVNERIVQQMHDASADFLPHISEFQEVGLTPVRAKTIDCMAVKESPAHLECELEKIVPIGRNHMVFGRVVNFRIDDEILLDNWKINIETYRPIARLAGNNYHIIGDLFSLEKHFDSTKVIISND